MDTFTWPPSYASQKKIVPRVLKSSFGDGYVQIAPEGASPVKVAWELTFRHLTDTDAEDMELFISSNRGQTFYWTPPGAIEESEWFCSEEVSRSFDTYNGNTISLRLESQGVYVPGLPTQLGFSAGWTTSTARWSSTVDAHTSTGLEIIWPDQLSPSIPQGNPPSDLTFGLLYQYAIDPKQATRFSLEMALEDFGSLTGISNGAGAFAVAGFRNPATGRGIYASLGGVTPNASTQGWSDAYAGIQVKTSSLSDNSVALTTPTNPMGPLAVRLEINPLSTGYCSIQFPNTSTFGSTLTPNPETATFSELGGRPTQLVLGIWANNWYSPTTAKLRAARASFTPISIALL